MQNLITFSANGKTYTINKNDAIMDNGTRILYIDGRYKNTPSPEVVMLPPKEWERIKPLLRAISYEDYYNKVPAFNGITIYVSKN